MARSKAQLSPGTGMYEPKARCVQPGPTEPRDRCPRCSQLARLRVAVVTENRVADRSEVRSHLMGAAGFEPARHRVSRGAEKMNGLRRVVRASRTATLDHGHLHPLGRGTAERRFHKALVCFELAVDDRQVRRSTAGPASWATSAWRAAGVRATTNNPEVPLSKRWTIPGRSPAGPAFAISGKRRTVAAQGCPRRLPAPGWTTRPAGLSTTTRSSSAKTTVASGVTEAAASASARGSVAGRAISMGTSTSSSSPPCRRRLPALTGSPPIRTPPPATILDASVRLNPANNARALSTLSDSTGGGRSAARNCPRRRLSAARA